ncbi:MAG: type II secretion system protein [Candidatus Gracilibacteria bacterium]|nr:type II secretion system protein [Candidatus Gracilibacteria bacterium]
MPTRDIKNSQKLQTKNSRGFTLVELIVVITILVVLSTIGFVNYISYTQDANDLKRLSDIMLIRSQLETYKKNHSLLYPLGSVSTQIMSGATTIAKQSFFDSLLAGKVGIERLPLDPKTKLSYLYSIAQDQQSYQVTATFENSSNASSYSPLFNKAYAADNKNSPIAYVAGTFIPVNKYILPGLLYSVQSGAVFTPASPASFDISTGTGIARVILRGQSTNMGYDMNGNMVGNNGSLSLSGLLLTVTLVDKTN